MSWSITAQQAERVQRLAQTGCCNCVDGSCLLLDDGEEQKCIQLICTQAIYCRFFREAVLPADKELYAEIVRQNAKGS